LVELPELSALSRGDVEAWKAFITRTTERYRPPYGRKEIEEPRQCVFAGTTNKEQYLYDETGNRRFWPAAVGKIDLDSLRRDREQLFAEAVRRYRARERWWPGPEFEREHIAQEQEDRVVIDDWEGPIADYLDKVPEHKTVQVCEIGRIALGFLSDSLIGTEAQNRIRRILHKLGWRRGKRRNKTRFYERPAPPPSAGAASASSDSSNDDDPPF
jgi:predicted P-loop ATPase